MGGLEILSMSRKVTFNVFKWEASHMYTLLFLSKSLVWVDKLLSTCSNGRPPICIRSRNLQAMNHESVISTFGVYALEISKRCITSRSSPRSTYTLSKSPSEAARVDHLHVRRIRSRNLHAMQHESVISTFGVYKMGGLQILKYESESYFHLFSFRLYRLQALQYLSGFKAYK